MAYLGEKGSDIIGPLPINFEADLGAADFVETGGVWRESANGLSKLLGGGAKDRMGKAIFADKELVDTQKEATII